VSLRFAVGTESAYTAYPSAVAFVNECRTIAFEYLCFGFFTENAYLETIADALDMFIFENLRLGFAAKTKIFDCRNGYNRRLYY
jgi:hypothetical protein